jgi:hypothetical protein
VIFGTLAASNGIKEKSWRFQTVLDIFLMLIQNSHR